MTITTITPQSREAWLAGRGVGFYPDMEADEYHADPCPQPSLSSSIAKLFITATAKHAWLSHPRLNPNFTPDEDDKFDLGTVAHEYLLCSGAGYQVLKFDDWRTKDAKTARDEARGQGKTPILKANFDRVVTLCGIVRERLEGMKIDLTKNLNESVFIWQERDAWCRSMLDSFDQRGGVIYDLKITGADLSDASLMRQIVNMGYDVSAAHYLRGVHAVMPELQGRIRFRWIFAEASAPHECRVIEASAMTMEIGARKDDFAIRRWQHCMALDEWPGYAPEITTLSLPTWAESQWLERELQEAIHG